MLTVMLCVIIGFAIAFSVQPGDQTQQPSTEPSNMPGQENPLTTHVLDTAIGRPAANLEINLQYQASDGQWQEVSTGCTKTDADGRCPGLLTQEHFKPGIYKISFETGAYHKAQGVQGFYPYVAVVFEIHDPSQHYHVPLLLSPFGYTTYRGS
ncbi:5-hydroxyisourate hydrolase-like [Glandiceps talaboti]